MKQIFILLFLLPLFAISQVKHTVTKAKVPATKQTEPKFDGFIINGTVTGFPDGTPVSFLNDQTGVPEQQATIQKDKFVIKGKTNQPGIKGLIFNNSQPVIPIFLDNSDIKISGSNTALNNLTITGSPSHALFTAYLNEIMPFEKIFTQEEYDTAKINKVAFISEDFVRKNPSSYVAPFAIIRFYQATDNATKMEELYNLLPQPVKLSTFGNYVTQLMAESKINPIGSVITDFSQTDTAGVPVNISAFRGKYVLVDFWASWCRPCRQENPNVVAAYDQFKNKNFTVLGVSLDQNKKAWVDAIKMDSLVWQHVSDLKGWGNSVAAIFKVTSIPQNLLLDPLGKIIAKNLHGGALQGRLNAILK